MLVDFYHLSSTPLERALPQICEKVLASGEKLLIVGETAVLDLLDTHLWSYSREAFLPHGKDSAPAPHTQPVLLSREPAPMNGATHIVLADGVWRDEALAFARIFYFFDGSSVDNARAAWRDLKDRTGHERRYWKQDERGKWVQGP